MHNSQELENVDQTVFLHVNHRGNCSCHIKPKVKGEVFNADVFESATTSVSGEEVQDDFDGPRNVGDPFDPHDTIFEFGFSLVHNEH